MDVDFRELVALRTWEPINAKSCQVILPHEILKVRKFNEELSKHSDNSFIVKPSKCYHIDKWLVNTVGQVWFHIDNHNYPVWTFELKKDAMMFKLVWNEEIWYE